MHVPKLLDGVFVSLVTNLILHFYWHLENLKPIIGKNPILFYTLLTDEL